MVIQFSDLVAQDEAPNSQAGSSSGLCRWLDWLWEAFQHLLDNDQLLILAAEQFSELAFVARKIT